MTVTQNEGEDDDLDAEMEDLESSQRALADELSRVDFSILDDGGGYGGSDGGTPNRSSPGFWRSNSRTKNKGKTNIDNEGDDWVPLLTAEENPPPNFSPIQVGQSESDQDYSSPLKSTPGSDRSSNRIKETTIISGDGDTTVISGEEFYNTLETPPRDEAKVEKDSVEKERQNQSNTSPLIPSSIFKASRKIKYDSLNTPPKGKSDDKFATGSNQKGKNSTPTILFVAGGEVEENLYPPVENTSSSTPLPGRLKIVEIKGKETETSGKKNYDSLLTPPRELPETLDTKSNQKNKNSPPAISSSSIASGRFKIVGKKGTTASSKRNYTQLKTPPKGKKGGRKQENKVQAVDSVVSTNDQLDSSGVVPSIASEVKEDSKPAVRKKLTGSGTTSSSDGYLGMSANSLQEARKILKKVDVEPADHTMPERKKSTGRLKIVEKKEGKVPSNKKNIDITTLLETPPKGEKKKELVTTGDRKQGNNIVQTDDSVGSIYLSTISSVAGEVEVEEGSKAATQKSPPGRLKIVEKTGGDAEILDQSNVAELSPPRFDPFGFGSGGSSESSLPISPIENTSTDRSPSNTINISAGDTTLSSIAAGNCSEESVRSPLASKNESVFQSLVSFAERISDRTPERQVEHSTRVLENLNSILTPPDNRPRDEIDKRLPAITPERRVLSLAEDLTGEGQGDEEDVFNTPPRDQDPSPPLSAETDNSKTEKVVIEGSNDSILGLSPISQSSEQFQSSRNSLESARLLETSPERNCIPESEELYDRESTPTPETTDTPESNDVKQIKSHDRSIIVSILPDDSDDEVMFDEDSPQYTDGGGFDYEQPPDPPDHSKTDYAFDQSKMPKNYDGNDNPDDLPAKKYSKNTPVHPTRNCKKIFLIVAILAFVIGLGLVLGTIFITSGSKNLASSPVPTLMPAQATMPDFSVTPSPTPTTTIPTSDAPTPIDTVSFTIPYIIYVANGLADLVPQSEYVPELVMSMDSLSSDILLNISKRRRMRGGRRKHTTVILPTEIISVSDTACPNYVMNSLCQEIVSKISLVDEEDSWQEFKDTTELAIEIGRLQYHLQRVDPDSPVEVIDAVWTPPAPTPASSPTVAAPIVEVIDAIWTPPAPTPASSPTVAAPIDFSSSDMPSDFPSLNNPTSIPSNPPSFSLLDLLVRNSFDDGEALNNTSSPQYMAYSWLLEDKYLMEYSRKKKLQRYSLATFYYATNGDQWLKNDFWLSDRTECHWYGKTGSRRLCNKEQELVNLELDTNNINGSLPPEIGLLSSSLERITLRGGPDTHLIGTIPSELGYLTRLKVFFVRSNNLSGTILSEVANWSSLEQLDLSHNKLSKTLPTELGLLAELKFFDVSKNSLSGSLPSELGNLKNCRKMFFEDNAFVSSIPTEIGNLKRLEALRGGGNVLTELPTELGLLSSADIISFTDSDITGFIPTQLGLLRKLRFLELQNNDLSGNIPSELASILGLQNILDLSNNKLSGSLPTELGMLVELRGLKLDHNFLSGTVPSEFSRLKKLTSLSLYSNDLSGSIPNSVCETFNTTYPEFEADCIDFDDDCACCTSCCVEDTCVCRYLGTPKEFLCYNQ